MNEQSGHVENEAKTTDIIAYSKGLLLEIMASSTVDDACRLDQQNRSGYPVAPSVARNCPPRDCNKLMAAHTGIEPVHQP